MFYANFLEIIMKKDIHPNYVTDAIIKCSCGAEFVTGATQKELIIETCSQCHPVYTGKKKIVDSTGRVDRFKKLIKKAKNKQATRKSVKSKEAKRQAKIRKQEKTIA